MSSIVTHVPTELSSQCLPIAMLTPVPQSTVERCMCMCVPTVHDTVQFRGVQQVCALHTVIKDRQGAVLAPRVRGMSRRSLWFYAALVSDRSCGRICKPCVHHKASK